MKGLLVLEKGKCFEGELLTEESVMGELVFNTGMTGYQECFTDPSYEGQIITLTYPLIGNYGVAEHFNQYEKPIVSGIVIDQLTKQPSNWECENTLENFIKTNNIPCIYNVDTRAVTKAIRSGGAMKAVIVKADTSKEIIKEMLSKDLHKNNVERVTTSEKYVCGKGKYKVALLDCGLKKNILKRLNALDCEVTVYPAKTEAKEILSTNPDGIFLSPGPGDPKDAYYVIDTVKQLIGKKPIFGICLGIQVLALALGAQTYKLPFGHRGSNHPVKDLRKGKVYITSQNHGYAVSSENIPDCIEITHINVNDNTVEGFRHKTLPIQAIQYHPEAGPGPVDNFYLFKEFIKMMEAEKND